MSRSPNDKPPQFRPFRVGMYGVYLTLTSAFSLLIIVSVVRSVLAMTPAHQAPKDQGLDEATCLARANALWRELEAERKSFLERGAATSVDDSWVSFRVQWLSRHREAEAACTSRPERLQLGEAFRLLERTMDLYTTHAVQFSGEVGPTVEKLRATLEAASGR